MRASEQAKVARTRPPLASRGKPVRRATHSLSSGLAERASPFGKELSRPPSATERRVCWSAGSAARNIRRSTPVGAPVSVPPVSTCSRASSGSPTPEPQQQTLTQGGRAVHALRGGGWHELENKIELLNLDADLPLPTLPPSLGLLSLVGGSKPRRESRKTSSSSAPCSRARSPSPDRSCLKKAAAGTFSNDASRPTTAASTGSRPSTAMSWTSHLLDASHSGEQWIGNLLRSAGNAPTSSEEHEHAYLEELKKSIKEDQRNGARLAHRQHQKRFALLEKSQSRDFDDQLLDLRILPSIDDMCPEQKICLKKILEDRFTRRSRFRKGVLRATMALKVGASRSPSPDCKFFLRP